MEKYRCMICEKQCKSNHSLSGHLRNQHNIFRSDYEKYYRKFFMIDGEDKCNYCGRITKFLTITNGFQKYCSHKCFSDWVKGKIYEELYSDDISKKLKSIQSKRIVSKEERIKKSKVMKINNPMSNKECRKKVRNTLLENHPMRGKTYEELYGKEKAEELKESRKRLMLSGGASKARRGMKRPSKPQMKLFNLIKETFPNFKIELEYPCCYN